MGKPERKRMSIKKMWIILVPMLVILLSSIVAVTSVMSYFSLVMDTYLGRGKRSVLIPKGKEGWDANFYNQLYTEFTGENGSQTKAAEVSQLISNEGCVLLKNKNGALPLAEKSTVSPLGFRYMQPKYGGEGSGSTEARGKYFVFLEDAVKQNFTINAVTVNKMKNAAAEKLAEAPGTQACNDNGTSGSGADTSTYIYEYNVSVYDGAQSSCAGTTGLVVIGRGGGESGDFKFDGYADGTRHQLTLTENEKAVIKYSLANCSKTVVILNVANPMELGILNSGEMEVDAILWVGKPGSRGFKSMSDILCGKVVPSGRTVDIYAADFFRNPTYANFGNYEYEGLMTYKYEMFSQDLMTAKFVEYEESVYVGYKYYETAAAVDKSYNYDKEVVYPFGYGLSFVDNDGGFSQKITSYSDSGDNIDLKIKVTNNSKAYSGKEVVQVYYTPEYTDLDKTYKIEKPEVNLVAFAKTGIINPGKSETIDISFAKEDMASYCFTVKNSDKTEGAYMLEAGDYVISIRKNSHDAIESKTWKNPNTVWYNNGNIRKSDKDAQALLDDKGNPTGIPARAKADPDSGWKSVSNQFKDCNDYMGSGKVTNLSRGNWPASQPTAPTANDRQPSADVLYVYDTYSTDKFDVNTNPTLGNVATSLVYNNSAVKEKQNNGLTVADLRGFDYYDENWDILLDQIDYSSSELKDLIFQGGYMTGKLTAIGLPETKDQDGPQGLSAYFNKLDWCAYCCQIVTASTWNVEMARALGQAIGQEMLVTGSSGWYAPGMNIHRSPFGGRVYEYYSEDSVLSGYMAVGTIEGAAECGIYSLLKHFALNEQETNRKTGSVWANEQAIREIYLKPFEIAVKNAKVDLKYISDDKGTVSVRTMRCANAVMTARNRIGAMPAGAHYNLITNVLRGEWGFTGLVETDAPCQVNVDAQLRAGSDLMMSFATDDKGDFTSNTAKHCLREAVHHLAYAVANSNAMQGVPPGAIPVYGMSPWVKWLIFANVTVYTAVLGISALGVWRTVDSKKRPYKYKRKTA